MEQPTEKELRTALRICKVFNQTPQKAGALHDLKRIRDRKTTWVGSEESALRIKIDKYIENGGGGFDA